jgi:hypothetical protein
MDFSSFPYISHTKPRFDSIILIALGSMKHEDTELNKFLCIPVPFSLLGLQIYHSPCSRTLKSYVFP